MTNLLKKSCSSSWVLFALLSMPLSITSAWAAVTGPWQLDSESQGIRLYTREVQGEPLKEFRGVMQVQAPLAQVAAMLADVPALPEWFFLMREARYLQVKHADDAYIYLAMKGLWPVSPRDSVAQVSVTQDPATLTIHVHIKSADGILPHQDGFVRIPSMHSSWRLTPVTNTHTEVEIVGHADPGGWIPVSIANFAVTTLPRESLKKMRVRIAQTDYRNVSRLYAKNPKLQELAQRLRFPGP